MATGLVEPFPGHYDASDPFGNIGIRDPNGPGHLGSDWNGLPAGTPVPSISDGVVVDVGVESGNGNRIGISIGDTGLYAGYIHLDQYPTLHVGDVVRQGDIIGLLGNTGSNSYGAHLHITISDSPQAGLGLGNKIDPYAYITGHLGPGRARGNIWRNPTTGQLFKSDSAANLYIDPDTGQLYAAADGQGNVWRDPDTGQLFKAA